MGVRSKFRPIMGVYKVNPDLIYICFNFRLVIQIFWCRTVFTILVVAQDYNRLYLQYLRYIRSNVKLAHGILTSIYRLSLLSSESSSLSLISSFADSADELDSELSETGRESPGTSSERQLFTQAIGLFLNSTCTLSCRKRISDSRSAGTNKSDDLAAVRRRSRREHQEARPLQSAFKK